MKDKYLFISDIHLGSPSFAQSLEREKRIVSLLLSMESEIKAVYLLGDIFDFWWEYKSVVPKYFTRLLGTLALMRDRGTEIHFFIGNHDQWIRDYFQKEIGMIVHREALSCELLGKRFFLAHGDGYDSNDKQYLCLRAVFRNRCLQGLFSAIHPRWSLALAHLWSGHSRTKHIGQEGMNKGFEEPIVKYFQADTHPIDYYVIGHYHFDKVFDLQGERELIILGSCFEKISYALWNGDKMELSHW